MVFSDRDEASQTDLSFKPLCVKSIVRGERADWSMVPTWLVLGFGTISKVLLKERRRFSEVVNVGKRLDDLL